MPNFYSNSPMCNRPDDEIADEDKITRYERNNTGGKTEVTRYSDGSSTYHHGGPCGPSSFDANGEEC